MTLFEETIKAFLDERAKYDLHFSLKYAKEGKSIEECCKYICEEVRKTGRQGFADDEVYGMAIHYYDEDNIKVEEGGECRVVVNRQIELTEDEKKEIERKARQELEDEEMARARARIRKEQEKEQKRREEREQKREEQGELTLF